MSSQDETEIYKSYHGLVGTKIEYDSSLTLQEIEARLHEVHEGRRPSIFKGTLPNSFRYIHPTVLTCEIESLQFIYRRLDLPIAKANGRMKREVDSKVTEVTFEVGTAVGFWLMILFFSIVFIAGLLFALIGERGDKDFYAGIWMMSLAVIGLIYYGYVLYKDLRKLSKIAEDIFI
jgi:hypothetical protein